MLFEMIGTAEKILKTMSLKHEFRLYLKRFGTAGIFFLNNVTKACILTAFKTIWNCRGENENNVSKACILVVSETIWNCRKNMES